MYRHDTDDADDLGLSPEFLADEDVTRDADGYPSAGPGDCVNDFGELACPGCRRCCPPDPECRPHGFGVESFEDPALAEAGRVVRERMVMFCDGPYALRATYRDCFGRDVGLSAWPALVPERDRLRRLISTHNDRLARAAARLWDRLCDECETHPEAVEKYTAWAKRAATRCYPKD
jgi:hypothetical protein